MDWFYASEAGQRISFAEEDLEGLVKLGSIGPETLIWNGRLPDWRKASLVAPAVFGFELDRGRGVPPPLAPSPEDRRAVLPLAGASMWCGIFSVMLSCVYGFGLFPGITAILLARSVRGKESGTGLAGENGYARAGTILGYAGTGISLFFLALLIASLVFGIGPSGDSNGFSVPGCRT